MVSRKRYLELEAQAEMEACIILSSTSAPYILKQNGLRIDWPSFEYKRNKNNEITGKGKDVMVRGEDVLAIDTWNGGKLGENGQRNFLRYMGYNDADLISLTEWEDRLTDEYYDFLTKHYTDRYANLDGKGKEWLYKVARLAVKLHIMRNKVDGYVNSLVTGIVEDDYICNRFAAFCYKLLLSVKLSGSDCARKVNNIVQKRADIRELEEQIAMTEDSEELSRLQARLESIKENDKDYRKQVIGEFIDAHYERMSGIVKIIANITELPGIQEMPELHKLASELGKEEDDDNPAASGVSA